VSSYVLRKVEALLLVLVQREKEGRSEPLAALAEELLVRLEGIGFAAPDAELLRHAGEVERALRGLSNRLEEISRRNGHHG